MTPLLPVPRRPLLAALLLAAAAPAAAATYQVDVLAQGAPATPIWTQTGVCLELGQEVQVLAEPAARWSFAEAWGAEYLHDAAGFYPWHLPNINDRFLCEGNHGELIGIVGADPYQGKWRSPYYDFDPSGTDPSACRDQVPGYLHVGELAVTSDGFRFVADRPGMLWLGMNDDADTGSVEDNLFGVIPATIVVGSGDPALEATLDLAPDTLQLRGAGAWITAYVEVPGADLASLVPESLVLRDGLCRSVAVDPAAPFTVGDHDRDGVPDVAAKFPRGELAALFAEATAPATVALTVTGSLADGTRLEGAAALRVVP